MLSDFEVAKPNQEFNQLHLDLYEVLVYTFKAKLYIPKMIELPGLMHLTTRGFVFEPKDESLALIKTKFSDGLIVKFYKTNFDTAFTEQQKKQQGLSELVKRLFRQEDKKADRKSNAPVGSKNGMVVLQGSKFYSIDRSPPSPFAGEVANFFFTFMVEASKFKDLRFSSFVKEDSTPVISELERMVDTIKKADNEDALIKDLHAKRAEEAKVAIKKKKNVEFFYPVTIVQTFERFYGYICLTDDRLCKIASLLNSTKALKLKFNCREMKWLTQYSYLHQDKGMEIFLYNTNLSYLVVFDSVKRAEKVTKLLKEHCKELIDVQLDGLTKTWMNNLMSNYDYLMYLNRLSNRSFNDVSRYPIFPWVISDFSNDHFKVNNKEQYRDLSKPIGTMSKAVASKIKENYNYMKSDPVPVRAPCHFNSFASTPGYLSYFYMRAVPNLILKLQSGAFAPGDRVFKGFESLWALMYRGHTQPVELLPEFYSLNKTDLFLNKYRVDLGVGSDGKSIDDVEVAKWASGVEDFMYKMRAALESDHCSLNLHNWIDLMFGIAQTEEAESRMNIYSESCYKEGFFKSIQGAHKQKVEAARMQVYEYGQLPNQLFLFAHPKKKIRAQIVYQGVKKSDKPVKVPSKEMIDSHDLNKDDNMKRQNSNILFHKLEKLRENFDHTESQANLDLETLNHDNKFFVDLSNSNDFDAIQYDSELE